MKRLVGSAAVMTTVLLVLAPRVAHACSCMAQTAEEAFQGHAAVFEGRIVEVRTGSDGARVAVVDVVQHWKGIEAERVEVSTPASSAACGVEFEPETSWLIYAQAAGDAWTTGLCDRTQRMSDSAEDLAFLGAGVVPVEVTEEDEVEPAEQDDEPPARGGCGSCAARPGSSYLGAGLLFAMGLLALRGRRTR